MRDGREVFLSSFDPERKVGAVYRMLDGRAELFAGGTPAAGTRRCSGSPRARPWTPTGNVYVADRQEGAVVRLDPTGRVLDRRWVRGDAAARARRGRAPATCGSAPTARPSAPWQPGPGEIWRVTPAGEATLVLRGPLPVAIAAGPAGHLFVADRQGAQIFVLTPEGKRSSSPSSPRARRRAAWPSRRPLPATQRAGLAGDLFVVLINRGAFQVNEVVRVSGPFEEFLRR